MKLYSRFQKRLATVVTGTMLLASFSPAIMASDYDNHWAKEAIERWSDKEVVQGYEDGTFKPKQAITRAELAKIIVQIFGLNNTENAKKYKDVSDTVWFAPYVSVVSSAGIMNDNGENFNPNEAATREEAAYAIAMAYKVSEGKLQFKDSDQISNWAEKSVGALAASGYINGRTDGKFAPKDTLTRADVITMIDKITAELINKAGTYNKNIQGNVVVNTGDVVLKDMVVDGNLYIAEGVGEGDVTLDHVEVSGTIYLEGAGENSFKILNGSKIKEVKVDKSNGKPVRIYGDKTVQISQIDLSSKCIIDGPAQFGLVNLLATNGVEIKSGSIEKLNVSVKASITLSSSATIKELVLNAVTELTGNGKIENCKVNTSGCKLSVVPKNTSFSNAKDTITIGSKQYSESNISQASTNASTSTSTNASTSSTNNDTSSSHHIPSSNPVTTSGSITTDPGTTDPGTTNPGTTNPGTTNPSVNIQPEKEPVVIKPATQKKDIASVSYQNRITILEGMNKEDVRKLLPTNVVVTYDDGTNQELACIWGELGNVTIPGDYTVRGTVSLPEESTDSTNQLQNIVMQITVQPNTDNSIVAPARITALLDGKTYIEANQSTLNVKVDFPKHVTTDGVLHVQIGNIAQTQAVTSTSALSVQMALNGIDALAAGKHTLKAWFECESNISQSISIDIYKKAASQMPTMVNNIEELEKALEIATDELLTTFTVEANNITVEQLQAYNINNNQILTERIKSYTPSGTADTAGNMHSITFDIAYKTMYEASKSYCEPDKCYSISAKAQKVLQVAQNIIQDKITTSMTKYEKEKAIHDYIVANTAYGTPVSDSTNPVYGVEGVLINHSAVCQGYAETMKLFMDMLGIECQVVTGTATNAGSTENHAWNLIKLDDNKWYHMDATWDDPTPDVAGRITYAYFNVTDDMIKEDHTIDSNKTYETADGTQYFYYADSKVTSVEEFTNKLNALLSNGTLSGDIYCAFNMDGINLQQILVSALQANELYGSYSYGMQGKVFAFNIGVQ